MFSVLVAGRGSFGSPAPPSIEFDVFPPDQRVLPSCHAKGLEEWGEWMRQEVIQDVPYCQVTRLSHRASLIGMS